MENMMANDSPDDKMAYLLGIIKAQTALVHYQVKRQGPPVMYDGKQVDGYTTLFHIDDNEILVSGCNVGSHDLRRSISALAHSLIEHYEIPRSVMALTLIKLARDITEGEL